MRCRRAPDAMRCGPPATAVARASRPSIPEARAAPRHLSSGGKVGGGSLAAVCAATSSTGLPVQLRCPLLRSNTDTRHTCVRSLSAGARAAHRADHRCRGPNQLRRQGMLLQPPKRGRPETVYGHATPLYVVVDRPCAACPHGHEPCVHSVVILYSCKFGREAQSPER